jgi:competence protein ComFC
MKKVADFLKFCWGSLLDIIFPGPSSCVSCGKLLKEYSDIMLCPECQKELYSIPGAFMEAAEFLSSGVHTESISEGFDYIMSPYRYEGPARAMVKGLKYKGRTYAARTMANLMAGELKKREVRFDIIVPVPVHPEKEKQRGYNQAELIAQELSGIVNKPLRRILEKHRNTPSQVTMDEKERWENVREAFVLNEKTEGLSVLLVDDVITTGATMYFCACQLKAGGAGCVTSIGFAMALQKNNI